MFRTFVLTAFAVVLSGSLASRSFAQGSLIPPGPPSPMMKTLDQIEARTPISQSNIPLIINTPGSFYFTQNIKINDTNTTAILIQSDNVQIDLNGFSLTGPGSNSGNCGSGIVSGGECVNIVIMNGFIENWRGDGICLQRTGFNQNHHTIKSIYSRNNGGDGIHAYCGRIQDCTACLNSGYGIHVGDRSIVLRCNIEDNGNTGLLIHSDAIVEQCVIVENHGCGIEVDYGSIITSCRLNNNAQDGIRANARNVIERNYLCANGWFSGNNGAGIHLLSGSNKIKENDVIWSQRGIEADSTGNLIICNSLTGNTNNYGSIAAGNTVGPIVTSANIGSSNNPHANYQF